MATLSLVDTKVCMCGEAIYLLIFCYHHYDAMGKSHTKYKKFEAEVAKVLQVNNIYLRDIRLGEFKECDLKSLEFKEIFRFRRMISKCLRDREVHRSTFYVDHYDEAHENIIVNYRKFLLLLKSMILIPKQSEKLMIPCPIMWKSPRKKQPKPPKKAHKIKKAVEIKITSRDDTTLLEIENFCRASSMCIGDIIKKYRLKIGSVINCWESPLGYDTYINYFESIVDHRIVKIIESENVCILLSNSVKLFFAKDKMKWFDKNNSYYQIQEKSCNKNCFLHAQQKAFLTDFFRYLRQEDDKIYLQYKTRLYDMEGVLFRIYTIPMYKWHISVGKSNVELPMEGYLIDSMIEIALFWILSIRNGIKKSMKQCEKSKIDLVVNQSIEIFIVAIFGSMVRVTKKLGSVMTIDDDLLNFYFQKDSSEFKFLIDQIETVVLKMEHYLVENTVIYLIKECMFSSFWEMNSVLFSMYLETYIKKITFILQISQYNIFQNEKGMLEHIPFSTD